MANDFVIRKEVTDRYAKALYDVALESGHMEPVLRDLETLEKFADENDTYWAHVTSPIVSIEDQKHVLSEVAENLHLCRVTLNFLNLLCANDRLICLQDIAVEYRNILELARGVRKGILEVAVPLDAKDFKDLEESLGQGMGKKLSLQQVVNSDLLGGAVLKVGSLMVDASLSGRLLRLQHAIQK